MVGKLSMIMNLFIEQVLDTTFFNIQVPIINFNNVPKSKHYYGQYK